jgi:sugar lactone lactonase YvrE
MDVMHFLSVGAELGEGPAWIDGALWFVDIKGRRIYRHQPDTADTTHWDAPEMIGWVLPSCKGDLIVGLQSGPHRFSPETGAFTAIGEVEAHLPANRLNDAAIDARGRIFFGTMDNDEASSSGRVYVLDAGAIDETQIVPTEITNGPAITPAGDRLYHVDTLARTIVAHAIEADGSLGPADPFLAFTGDEGHPDGAICDAEGGVWVGFYGGWAARRFSPAGVMTDEIRFPVANVTKVALGGPDGRTAFATTARQGLDEAALAAQPLAGDIFTFRVTVPAAPSVRANS